MKAQVIHGHGNIDDMRFEANWPDPVPGPGEVVLKVKACTLNYHDIFTLRGMPGISLNMPLIMGIDVAGEVAEIGEGVEGWQRGDRVMVDPFDTQTGKLLGERMDGGLAEFVKIPSRQLVRLAPEVSFEAAAALPVAYGTAYRMMRRGRLQAGEKVFILGASGGVGTCCVQLAKLAGCQVIVAASSQEKLDKLREIGADDGVDYTQGDWVREMQGRYGKARFAGRGAGGVDVVVNFTGGDTWVPSLKCLINDGRLLTCGATAGFDPKEDIRLIWTFELNIIGSNGWMRDDLERLLELVQLGKLNPVIDRVLPLREAQEAFRLLDQRRIVGKIVVAP